MRTIAIAFALSLGFISKAKADPDCPPAPFLTVIGKTGSMRPTFQGGELRTVEPAKIGDLKVGDIIVWRWVAKQLNVIHRVWKVGRAGNGRTYVITKGDNNWYPDPVSVTAGELRGIVRNNKPTP